nr:8637_t:CDS:10 [Entrophospora candida]
MNYPQPSALPPGYNEKFNYGRNLNVFKAYKKPIESEYYIIKGYDDIISYKREIHALISLKGARNIMQIVDYDSHKIMVVSECALYDLETFFEQQAQTQKQAEKVPIIKDIVAALSECQHKNIVHLDLSPKNLMYFRDENWKLIDFDSACIADKTYVLKTTTIKYCSPELIQAEEDGRCIKAQFSMDMFSFGLILYYIENGYWNIADQKCPDKKIPITTTEDPYAVYVIENLLEKNVNNRKQHIMKSYQKATFKAILTMPKIKPLEKKASKMQIEKEAKELNSDIKDDESKQTNFDSQQEQSVLNLTETIPQMNEKTPRVFIMVPERREFKNLLSWYTNPFRLYFVCEHNNNWHVPEQEGYAITKVPEFIKKYGPWIRLCTQALFELRMVTSNLFPQEIGNILSGIFNVKIDNSDETVQYFQEIIDTIGVGVKEIIDINPDFIPLEYDRESNYPIINASGIRALASFIKSKQKSEKFGGLVQCIDKNNQNVIWLCDKHRNDNDYTLKDEPQSPCSPHPSDQNPTLPTPQTSHELIHNSTYPFYSYYVHGNDQIEVSSSLLPISKPNSGESMGIDSLVPLIILVNEILLDVLNNALSSECIYFGTDRIKKEALNMCGNLANLKQFDQNWLNSQQERLLKIILKRYIVGYVYFLTVIYRYCYVKATNKSLSLAFNSLGVLPVVNKIIKATNALNEFYNLSIKCLENNDQKGIEQILSKLNSSSKILNKIAQSNKFMKNNALKEWYIIRRTSMIFDIDGRENECNGEDRENKDGYKKVFNDILVIKNRMLKESILVFGKELNSKCFNEEHNIDCIEKEIYMYNKFKPILHYEFADYGDLYKYLKNNQSLPENEKLTLDAKLSLSLDICLGLEFLHRKRILHLDLRSSNIYLFENRSENEFPKPKISNFLYSIDMLNNHTIVKPCLPKSIDNQVRKRWHEPQRLKNEKYNCTFESDYYSLGMLLWEIFNATGALPYEKIEIENLYEHLRSKNGLESFPNNLHKPLISKITRSWAYNIDERTTLTAMAATLRRFKKKKKKNPPSTQWGMEKGDLPSWIEKSKLQYGLIIDEIGVKKGTILPIQPFIYLSNLKINRVNLADSIKSSLTTTNSLLHSHLLKSDIKVVDDEMIKFFNQEVPFINLKVKDSWNLKSKQNIEDSWDLGFKKTTHYEISSQQIELTYENFVPSNELIKAVCEALDTENPYHELEIIFNEYGHLLCKKIILGGKLSRSQHLDLNGNFKDQIIEKPIDPLSINNNELGEMLKEWDEIHRINGHTTKINSIIDDKYQIYGTIFNKDSEKCSNIIIKFKHFDQYGFSIIIERFDENQNDVLHIIWAMVGSPMEIGFYSKNTRNLEMMNSEKSSGTDLGDIFNMSSLNNIFSRVFGDLLDEVEYKAGIEKLVDDVTNEQGL